MIRVSVSLSLSSNAILPLVGPHTLLMDGVTAEPTKVFFTSRFNWTVYKQCAETLQ